MPGLDDRHQEARPLGRDRRRSRGCTRPGRAGTRRRARRRPECGSRSVRRKRPARPARAGDQGGHGGPVRPGTTSSPRPARERRLSASRERREADLGRDPHDRSPRAQSTSRRERVPPPTTCTASVAATGLVCGFSSARPPAVHVARSGRRVLARSRPSGRPGACRSQAAAERRRSKNQRSRSRLTSGDDAEQRLAGRTAPRARLRRLESGRVHPDAVEAGRHRRGDHERTAADRPAGRTSRRFGPSSRRSSSAASCECR